MKDMNNLVIFQHCVIKSAFEVLGERDFSRFIWHVNNPLATQERKSKVFSQPKSRKIQGDLTIISTSGWKFRVGRAPIIFLDAIWQSSIHVSWPPHSSLSGRGITKCVSLYLLFRSWIGSCQIFASCRFGSEAQVEASFQSKGPFLPPAIFLPPSSL